MCMFCYDFAVEMLVRVIDAATKCRLHKGTTFKLYSYALECTAIVTASCSRLCTSLSGHDPQNLQSGALSMP